MIRFWSICQNTFLQTIRQPIYGVLIVVTFAVLVLSLPLTGWTVGADYHTTDQRMMENLGLSTLLVSGLLVAAFAASSALSREIRDRTALTVISKPVRRSTFVLGKFAGVTAAVAVAYYLCTLVFLMTVRHKVTPAASDPIDWPVIVIGFASLGVVLLTAMFGNLLFGWTFVAAAVWSAMLAMTVAMGLIAFIGKGWTVVPFAQDIRPELLVGIGLMFMAVIVLTATAVAASTRLGQILTLLICAAVFALGSMHPFLFGRHQDILVLRGLGWVAPNLTYFYPLDALTEGKSIPAVYVAEALLYCIAYTGALLAAGVALFQTRQLEASEGVSGMPEAPVLLGRVGQIAAVAAGLAALIVLSLQAWHTVEGFVLAGGLIVGGAAGWLFWGFFIRGRRWAYWIAVVLSGAALVLLAAVSFWPALGEMLRLGGLRAHAIVAAIVAAVVVLILALPKTRRHFRSAS